MNRKRWRLFISSLRLKRLVSFLLFLYVMVGGCAYFFGDRLIFHPDAASYSDNDGILKLTAANGTQISAQYLPHPTAPYTILFSHGNAEDLGEILPTLELLHKAGFAVFSYDYQGYGTSQGNPSEQNAYSDGEAAYEYLTRSLRISPQQIIVHGRSVGAGVAIALAVRHSVAGLIVESAFTSAFVVLTQVPLYSFDRFPNLERISKVRSPVLVIHGTGDRIIPLRHGRALFEAAPAPKQFLWVEGAGHDNVSEVAGEHYVETLRMFAEHLD